MCWGCAGGLCLVFVFLLGLGRHIKNGVQVPRPSEEGHGARSGESDVGRCGHAACVVTAVYLSLIHISEPTRPY